MRHVAVIALFCGLVALGHRFCLAGCGCGPGGVPPCGSSGAVGPTCGPAFGPAAGPACGPACGPGVLPGCGPGGGVGPVRWVLSVLGFGCGCGDQGCGGTYWGDWCSSPPAYHDPCDCFGNYVGPAGPVPYSPGWYAAAGQGIVEEGALVEGPQIAVPAQVVQGQVIQESEHTVDTRQAKPATRVIRTSTAVPQRRVPLRR